MCNANNAAYSVIGQPLKHASVSALLPNKAGGYMLI